MDTPILQRGLLCLSLTLFLGCDVFPIPLKPDVPAENLSQFKYDKEDLSAQNLSHWLKYGFWSGHVSQQGVALQIAGSVLPPYYVGKRYYLLFPMKITNTRVHPIRLTRDDIAVKIDEAALIQDTIELQQVKMTEREQRTVTTPTYNVQMVTVGSGSTVFVDVWLRYDRVRTKLFPQDSVILHIEAFHDTETGEKIPFTVRFQKVK